jgi:hypothetical protein
MVIQLGFGDRCTRVQVQSDFVQLFQRLDLAVLDQLRDLVHSNIGLRETGGQGQGSGGEQGGQVFMGFFPWVSGLSGIRLIVAT